MLSKDERRGLVVRYVEDPFHAFQQRDLEAAGDADVAQPFVDGLLVQHIAATECLDARQRRRGISILNRAGERGWPQMMQLERKPPIPPHTLSPRCTRAPAARLLERPVEITLGHYRTRTDLLDGCVDALRHL